MRTCPVCNSVCFDDMDICYGCMHRFAQPAPSAVEQPEHTPESMPRVAGENLHQAQLVEDFWDCPSNPDAFNVEEELSACDPLVNTIHLPNSAAGFDITITVRPTAENK